MLSKLNECHLYDNIFIPIPEEILNSESYKDIKSEIIQFENTFITEVVREDGYHIRIFTPMINTNTIRIMVDMVVENEMKIRHFEKDRYNNLQKLEVAQREMNKIKKLNIDKDLLGLIIGKQGANITRLKNTYNVTINIDSEVPGDKAFITISGDV
jgi:hypothetical protein